MAIKLTDAQRRCLAWYEKTRDLHPRDCMHLDQGKWTMRQVNRLLEFDMLKVGPGGWHVPTDAGRAAIAAE